ncbi:MAG TPA: hypothetical protein VK041_07325, partial [Opitutales bacterium]|nr:hypothetical protein [Opitutales bacterium]
ELFEIDAAHFFAHNPTADGTFSVVRDGREIAVHYMPIPEPRTFALGAGAIVLLLAMARRRLRRN